MLGRKLGIKDGNGVRKNYADVKGLEEKQKSECFFLFLYSIMMHIRCVDKPRTTRVFTNGGIV